MTRLLPRPCVVCGSRTTNPRGRCDLHDVRGAYSDPSYRRARAAAFRRAAGRCERILPDGSRCPNPATEADHIVPLGAATTLQDALRLNRTENLAAVCAAHNPRGR